jgi:hypothetical protein
MVFLFFSNAPASIRMGTIDELGHKTGSQIILLMLLWLI